MTPRKPGLPVPEPLRGNETDTWAERTLKIRMPEIGRRAVRERDWPEGVAERLSRLADDIPAGRVESIRDAGAPDVEAWHEFVAPYAGMGWLDVPWFFAENYFYRRMLAASGYFQPGPTYGLDPFGPEKSRGLEQGLAQHNSRGEGASLEVLLLGALWGNRADLSMWPAQTDAADEAASATEADSHLLVDDRTQVTAYLNQLPHGPRRIDIVLDNAGAELLADLTLADGLLQIWPDCRLVLHVKPHPTFVSDTIVEDVERALRAAGTASGSLSSLAESIDAARQAERLDMATDAFWTSPLAGWTMPQHLRDDLATSDLVVFKGDANYRRLLGDRHWPFSTPFETVLSYFPAPVLCLRALKADVAAGLDPARMEEAERSDPDWMIDGRWAVIQFAEGDTPSDL